MDFNLREVDFDRVGGLREHIKILKEMIIYPLLYRELFESYGIQLPRGVLFHGPPGTGKTLTAGAVAAECSKSSKRKVSFYVRKGSDCLNKYVGESEKLLQNLFAQAYTTRPSIIFFDEIDGLVPTRSESNEVHASVVSTLLALMDGLDSKSEVFVIGATNRIDMVDPALRRPGRFDKELYFPLPSLESRMQIFRIHTRNWKRKPTQSMIHKLAGKCVGFCGADIQSLCAQAVLKSFHRHFPQVADTSRRYRVNFRCIQVEEEDFWEAKDSMVPASQRTYVLPSRPLSTELEPLLRRGLDECLQHINKSCPFKFLFHNRDDYSKNKSLSCPRFLLIGREGHVHVSHIAPAILQCFDHLPVAVVDLHVLQNDGNRVDKLEEARHSMPSVVYMRDMSSWWNLVEESAKQVLITSVESLDTCTVSQIFLFATINASSYEDLPTDVKKLFPKSQSFVAPEPTEEERRVFFGKLIVNKNLPQPKMTKGTKSFGELCHSIVSRRRVRTGSKRPRRSLRLRGLEAEYLGLDDGGAPKLSHYYSSYLNRFSNVKLTESRKKNKFTRRKMRIPSTSDIATAKKPKLEEEEEYSERVAHCKANDQEESSNGFNRTISASDARVKADRSRIHEIVQAAVNATATCPPSSVVRLYEELEIIALRYTSKSDRSSLPEELERAISVFVPT